MKKALLLVLTVVAVSPVATEAQLSQMTGDERDLAELEEIGGVYFERSFLGIGRRTRFIGNVVKYQWHNGCWDNMITAVRITNDCVRSNRETPDRQEKDVQILGSLIDGVFHGEYNEWNYRQSGSAHTLNGQYNSGSKCGRWRSFWMSAGASEQATMSALMRPVYQETFPPC